MNRRTVQLTPAVMVMTTVTAIPKPKELFQSFEIEMKEHMPRKLVRSMLLVKMEAKNRVMGFTRGGMVTP
jgi:hypothetical protein